MDYEEVKEIRTETNQCSEIGEDECFESHLKSQLIKLVGCSPPWIDVQGLQSCNQSIRIIKADEVLQQEISILSEICKPACHKLIVTSGSRNFEWMKNRETRVFIYFPFKVRTR